MADRERHEYLTLTEAADLVAVSVKTLRRRSADGTIPAYRCGRRVSRIGVADVERAFHLIPSARH